MQSGARSITRSATLSSGHYSTVALREDTSVEGFGFKLMPVTPVGHHAEDKALHRRKCCNSGTVRDTMNAALFSAILMASFRLDWYGSNPSAEGRPGCLQSKQ